jgi:hypothetical protein
MGIVSIDIATEKNPEEAARSILPSQLIM